MWRFSQWVRKHEGAGGSCQEPRYGHLDPCWLCAAWPPPSNPLNRSPIVPDDLLRHLAADRAVVAAENFTHSVRAHPYVRSSPRLAEMADRIEQQMAELVLAIGQ